MPDTERHAEFELETTQSMIDALAMTGKVLRLCDRHPGLAGEAIKKTIEIARASERAPVLTRSAALKALW